MCKMDPSPSALGDCDPFADEGHEWAVATAEVIRRIEAQQVRPKSESCALDHEDAEAVVSGLRPPRRTASERLTPTVVTFGRGHHHHASRTPPGSADLRYIDDSSRSSLSTGHEPCCSSPTPSTRSCRSADGCPVQHEVTDSSSKPKNEQALIPDTDRQSVYSLYLEKDFRYYFQHPYARLFVAYFVIFCNFLIFAEDPISHSHTESEIPVVGNVFSFIVTKYPPEWTWVFLKVTLWLIAMVLGMIAGKYAIHHLLLRRVFRLKMFRDEQGSWMIMLLTVMIFVYFFSLVYNFLLAGHPLYDQFRITTEMGITNANFMKAAACGTWLGDFLTAWMVTDLMLQDDIYSDWARPLRSFWKSHGRTRIVIFWTGSVMMTALVVTLIVSDWISWDTLNRDFVATTELSRAFLASFILVMDLLIVMQDWDFPHFVCDLDIKLPGMHVASFKLNLFQKYVSIPDVEFHITGKWFNYGIIVIVMILDLNMWKNQIFYNPSDYGQYTGPYQKIFTVDEQDILNTGNRTLWTYQVRSAAIDPTTNQSFRAGDMMMNSRFLDYDLSATGLAFIPSLLGFVMFATLTSLYGRFPPKTDETAGGRFRKRKREAQRSSWRRERGTPYRRAQEIGNQVQNQHKWSLRGGRRLADIVVAWNQVYGTCASLEFKPPA